MYCTVHKNKRKCLRKKEVVALYIIVPLGISSSHFYFCEEGGTRLAAGVLHSSCLPTGGNNCRVGYWVTAALVALGVSSAMTCTCSLKKW